MNATVALLNQLAAVQRGLSTAIRTAGHIVVDEPKAFAPSAHLADIRNHLDHLIADLTAREMAKKDAA